MNGTQEIADAIIAWTRSKLETIQTGYAFPADIKTGDLPDVAAEIQHISLQRASPENFPVGGVEQVLLRVYDFHLIFLVEPEPADTATKQLEAFVDTMTQQIVADPAMEEALPGIALSILFSASFTPPFVEFEDGTRGRIATMELKVGEVIDSGGAQL
jgi:hypothetical protein